MRMTRSVSITRRLVVTVLILELLSAVTLIGAITVHEWRVQLKVFDASLMATAESLMGAVQPHVMLHKQPSTFYVGDVVKNYSAADVIAEALRPESKKGKKTS